MRTALGPWRCAGARCDGRARTTRPGEARSVPSATSFASSAFVVKPPAGRTMRLRSIYIVTELRVGYRMPGPGEA